MDPNQPYSPQSPQPSPSNQPVVPAGEPAINTSTPLDKPSYQAGYVPPSPQPVLGQNQSYAPSPVNVPPSGPYQPPSPVPAPQPMPPAQPYANPASVAQPPYNVPQQTGQPVFSYQNPTGVSLESNQKKQTTALLYGIGSFVVLIVFWLLGFAVPLGTILGAYGIYKGFLAQSKPAIIVGALGLLANALLYLSTFIWPA